MNLILGLGIALVLAFGIIQLGSRWQKQGRGLKRPLAVGIGFGVGLGIWAVLKMVTHWPMEIVDAVAIGPGVALAQVLTRSDEGRR